MPDRQETRLRTDRLLLRPLQPGDAAALQRLLANWNVVRMTTRIPHPYPEGAGREWIAAQAEAWASGTAYVFALELDRQLIGLVGLERSETDIYELGYWLGEPWWGRGFATEAAMAATCFAFESLGAKRLTSGHFTDNPASGRVLAKCGFRDQGAQTLWSVARGARVAARRLIRRRNEVAGRGRTP